MVKNNQCDVMLHTQYGLTKFVFLCY